MKAIGASVRRRLAAALLAALAVVVLGACGSDDDGGGSESNAFEIAGILASSGPTAPYAADMKKGIEYAIDKFNQEGGIEGKDIKITYFDHAGEKTQAVSLANEVGPDEKYMAIIGANDSPSTLAIAPVAGQFEVPMVSPGASVPWPGEFNPYTYRVQLVNSALIDELVPKTKETFDIDTAAIIYAYDDEFAVAASERFEEQAEEAGVEIVANEKYATRDKDFRSQLTNIIDADPDALYMSVLTENAGLMMKQARELGFKGRFVGDLGLSSPTFAETGGEATDGAVTGAPYDPRSDRPSVQEFVKALEERNNKTPGVYEALGYDAVLVIKEAAEIAEKPVTRESLAQALGELQGVEGVTGTLSFEGPGDVTRDTIELVVMENGEYKPYEAESAEGSS